MELKVFVQPRASRARWVGWHNNEIKIALTAPPVDGAANKALVEFVAKSLKISKSSVVLSHGETSRHKTLKIELAESDVKNAIEQLIK